jgi:hypothetical protein
MQRSRLVSICLCGLYIFFAACTAEEGKKTPNVSGAETPSAQTPSADSPSAGEKFPAPGNLVYDLKDARRHEESLDQDGRLVSRVYELVDGQKIVITYSWEGASNRCAGAVASVGGRTIAKAVSKGLTQDSNGGHEIEVEESQFDESGREVYRGHISYLLGYHTKKVAEWPVSGQKIYELFLEWGGFR